jgi:rhodanese-related sulfurtransferase
MKKLFAALVFATSAIAFSASFNANANANVTEVSVPAVQEFVKTKAPNVVIVDANNEQARAEVGMVPGAIKLSSYDKYALTELPADKSKTLVFYCYNSYCGASHAAAERAISAGYTDARVMKAGIVGWNEATKK